jgi:hypothetical protein
VSLQETKSDEIKIVAKTNLIFLLVNCAGLRSGPCIVIFFMAIFFLFLTGPWLLSAAKLARRAHLRPTGKEPELRNPYFFE